LTLAKIARPFLLWPGNEAKQNQQEEEEVLSRLNSIELNDTSANYISLMRGCGYSRESEQE